ncbi:hypothetical protein [Chitinivorax sp. B]|uniref:hypothetical protein n=1 Tax=Chitinivorax sp. B TaxID=2502235 RepID=UPI001484E988|nr:hypothetical protein [Chitinivorax sp. B]
MFELILYMEQFQAMTVECLAWAFDGLKALNLGVSRGKRKVRSGGTESVDFC